MKKYDEIDDGRTVADMDVEGMPWNTPGGFNPFKWMTDRHRRFRGEDPWSAAPEHPVALTDGETRQLQRSALLGVLVISLLFIALAVLFILFCIYVWFA